VIAAPAVYLEIVIQGEDLAGADLAGQMDQTASYSTCFFTMV